MNTERHEALEAEVRGVVVAWNLTPQKPGRDVSRHIADALAPLIDTWLRAAEARGAAAVVERVEAVLADSCHHCGQMPEDDGDHSCPCLLTDSECLLHTAAPVAPLLPIRAALAQDAGGEGQ